MAGLWLKCGLVRRGVYALLVIVRTDTTGLREALDEAYARLLPHTRFEENHHLANVSMHQVVDRFYPAAQQWRIVAAEPGFHWMLFIVEHPKHGLALFMLGGTSPGGVSSEESWTAMDAGARARAVHVSVHAQAVNRLALLSMFNLIAEQGQLEIAEETLLDFAFSSDVFMDDTVRAMAGLGTFTDLQERAAARRAAMLTAQTDTWPAWSIEDPKVRIRSAQTARV